MHCLRYTRVHVALSSNTFVHVALCSLHASACCTVFSTRVPMLHCLRCTLAHVALSSLHEHPCCTVLATRLCMLCFQVTCCPRSGCLTLLCRLKHGELLASFMPKTTISSCTDLLCFLAQMIFPSLHAVSWPAI